MSVNEFLIALYEELKYLPKKKREQIINLYREKMNLMLDSGEAELKVVSSFKSPKELADKIYEEEGVDYLTRYKKHKKIKDVLIVIISIVCIFLVVCTSIALSYLLILSIIKLTKLVFLLKGALEIILMSLLIIGYDITIFLVLVYLIDLFLLTFNLLMDNIFKAFGKEYKLIEFSLTDIFDKLFKKKNITSKILIGFAIGTITLFVCNFACKTYFYRSFTQTSPDNYVIDYNLNDYSDITNIKFNIDEAILYVKHSDKFELNVKSEFNRKVCFNKEGNELVITTDYLKKFDFLNLLEEPLPVFTLYIPTSNFNLETSFEDGYIYLEDVAIQNLKVDMTFGNIILNNLTASNADITITKCGLNVSKSNFADMKVVADEGQVIIDETNLYNIDIHSDNAGIQLQNIKASKVLINTESAPCYIKDLKSDSFKYETNSSNIEMKEIHSINEIDITAKLKSNITLYTASAKNISVSMNTGSFTGYYLTGDGVISTFGNLALKELTGSYDITCFGTLLDLYDSMFDLLKIKTQNTQTMLNFVKANKIIYEGTSSQTVASLVFAKQIKMRDDSGDLNFDYDKSLTDDIEKYNKYYVKLEKLEISANALYRVENGVEFGELE